MPTDLPAVIDYASGSVGVKTYARNQHGPYRRDRVTPTDPGTPEIQRSRRHWARTVFRWRTLLTADQYKAWRAYAAQQVEFSPSPRRYVLTAQQAFMRVNMPRAETPLMWLHDPPTSFEQSAWTTPWNTDNSGAGFVLFTIDPTDAWATENGGGMLLSLSNGQKSTINFFKSPFRRAKLVRGFAVSPPAATQFLLDPWGALEDPRRWLRTYTVRGDGRVSSARILPLDTNV